MCYWVGTKKVREEMERRFKEGPQDEIAQLFYKAFIENPSNEFKEYYVAIGKGKPTLTTLIKDEGKLQFRNMRWTLDLPSFDFKTQKPVVRELLNSTCEKVFTQHKGLIITKRCLVPIDGYYEYYHLNGETYPYFIYPREGGIFYAGGIWERKLNEETGEVAEAFSIITTPSNSMVGKIHNNPKAPNGSRMLLLLKQEQALDYMNDNLNAADVKKFFNPYDENCMEAHPVMRFQRKEFYEFINTPKIRERQEYPELVA